MYYPREDSFLLEKSLKFLDLNSKVVLDLGCGSCFLTEILRKKAKVVIASDLDFDVLKENRNLNRDNVFLVNANLLSPFKRVFDLIFFNPPYLNFDEREGYYLDTTGGIFGYEVTLSFLDNLINSLKVGGVVFLVASNYTINKLKEKIEKEKIFSYEILEKKDLVFEEIFLVKINYSNIFYEFKDFFNKNKNLRLKFFSKGKNSIILETKDNWLLKINKRDKNNREFFYLSLIKRKIKFYYLFLPEFYLKDDILFIKKIEGLNLKSIIEKSKKERKYLKLKYEVLIRSLYISFLLDKLGINKTEMNHPEKHIIYSKGKVYFIDFEKAHLSKKRKNVTQLVFFIVKEMKKDFTYFRENLDIFNKELKKLLRKYKHSYSFQDFKEIVKFFYEVLNHLKIFEK